MDSALNGRVLPGLEFLSAQTAETTERRILSSVVSAVCALKPKPKSSVEILFTTKDDRAAVDLDAFAL